MLQERRDSARIPFDEDVIVYAGGRRLSCRGTDLSAGGIGLLPPEGAKPGTHVIVDMDLAGSESFAVEGYLVRQERHAARWSWGVQFRDLTQRTRQKLAGHIAERRTWSRSRRVLRSDTLKAFQAASVLPNLSSSTPSSVALPSMASPVNLSRGLDASSPRPAPSQGARAVPLKSIPTSPVPSLVMPPPPPTSSAPAPAPAFDEPLASAMEEDEEISTLVVPPPPFPGTPAPSSASPLPAPSPVIPLSLPSPPASSTMTSLRPDIVDAPSEGYDQEVALVATANAAEAKHSLDDALDEALAQLYVKALHEIDDL